jgi:hypothetical protein
VNETRERALEVARLLDFMMLIFMHEYLVKLYRYFFFGMEKKSLPRFIK